MSYGNGNRVYNYGAADHIQLPNLQSQRSYYYKGSEARYNSQTRAHAYDMIATASVQKTHQAPAMQPSPAMPSIRSLGSFTKTQKKLKQQQQTKTYQQAPVIEFQMPKLDYVELPLGQIIQKNFWFIFAILIMLPLINSALFNSFSLYQEVSKSMSLSSQKAKLERSSKKLNNKILEYSSESGLKRAIKEEMNLVESNEIVIKILD